MSVQTFPPSTGGGAPTTADYLVGTADGGGGGGTGMNPGLGGAGGAGGVGAVYVISW